MFWVPNNALLGAMPDLLTKANLPRDAMIVKTYPNPEKNETGFLLMHHSFPLVANDDIPYISYQG